MTKTMKAVLISGSIVAVAVIVVVALAIAGVFGGGTIPSVDQAIAESASNVQVFRNLNADAEFVISSSDAITAQNYGKYIVISNEGAVVSLKVTDYHNGNYGVTAADGFVPGNAYSVTLYKDAAFVAEEYKEFTYLVFTVAKVESEVLTISENVVLFSDYSIVATSQAGISAIFVDSVKKGEIEAVGEGADYAYIIEFYNSAVTYTDDKVLVIGDAATGKSYKVYGSEVVGTSVYVYANDAEIEDVFSEVNINKSLTLDEINLEIYEEETINSILNSDFVMEAAAMLFGKTWDFNDNISLKLDFALNEDNIGVTLALTFKNLGKNDMGSITLNVANTIAVDPSLNFQKDPKQFEFSCDMTLVTKPSVSFTLGGTWSDAATATELITKLASLAGKELDQGATFMKWTIPVGSLPICITYEMGFEVSFGFLGTVGVEAANTFSSTFGVVYVDKNFSGYGNYDNDFSLTSLTLQGQAEIKAGITNAIGISAYGVVGVDLCVAVGAYFDVGGKLAINCDELVAKKFSVGAAYYTEAGIYLDLDLEGEIFTKTIAKKTLLAKKWPLWSAGYRYLPSEFVTSIATDENNNRFETADDYIYLNSTYTYLTGFKAKAYDLKFASPSAGGNFGITEATIDWDQFNYEFVDGADSYLTLEGNKLSVKPDVSGSFTAKIKVTSKVNKAVTKYLVIKKMPEAPSATATTAVFDVNEGGNVTFDIQLNTSKFIKLSADNAINNGQYDLTGNTLTIYESYLKTLAVGNTQELVFESNKGNLVLSVNCFSSKAIEVVGSASASFDKAAPASASFAINTFGNAITSLTLNNVIVNSSFYSYQAATGKLVIYGAYLNSLDAGEYTYVATAANGTSVQVTVTVADDRRAELAVNEFSYNKNSAKDLKVAVSFYNDSFVRITENGNSLGVTSATATANAVTIRASYLKACAKGLHTFVIATAKSSLTFTVNVDDSANAVVFVETAKSYDKATGGDVTFAYAKVGAGIIEAGDYTFDGSKIIFAEAYLKALPVGGNEFVVNGQTLVINVVNTTPPSVSAATFTFDKGVPSDLVIDIALQEATLSGIAGLSADDYAYAEGKLTVYAEALEAMEYGLNTLVVNTSVNAFSFGVNVIDSRAVSIATEGTIIYNLANKDYSDLEVAVNLYDADFVNISGNDIRAINYRYNNGIITFANEFVFGLANGRYEFVLATSEGNVSFAFNIAGAVTSYTDVGYGTAQKPYLIFTYAQLKSLAEASKNSDFAGVYFRLNSDIECNNGAITPIGTESKRFAGTFDGNGYSVKKVAINAIADDYTGFFSYIGTTGVVKNLTIEEGAVSFNSNGAVGAGIIAGANYGKIYNVKVIGGTINATSKSWLANTYFDIGGVCGYNAGTIDGADVEIIINASIKGKSIIGIELSRIIFHKSYINVGAVVGYAYSGEVINVSAEGSIVASAPTNDIAKAGVYGEKESAAVVDGSFVGTVA